MDWTPVYISAGAVVGALGRYYANQFWVARQGTGLPYGTLFVNLTGALVMGFAATALGQALNASPQWENVLLVGFLGAYTTFSTYVLDIDNLRRVNAHGVVLLYGLGTPVLGFVGVEIGRLLALGYLGFSL